MKLKKLITIILIVLFSNSIAVAGKNSHVFCGGPSGGTFMFFANGISNLMNSKLIKVTAIPTKGSIDNIRIVNNNAAEFGVAYSGDAFLASRGGLKGDSYKYQNITTVGFLYNAPVQIIVRKDSNIYTLKDLVGRKLGVGGAGSGSAANAERVLSAIGVWDNVTKYYIGYRNALGAFNNGLIDAFWIYAGYPNSTVIEASMSGSIRILDLSKDISTSNMLEKLPFLAITQIPKNTYKGIDQSVTTLEGSAIIIANKNVPNKDVTELLKNIYSKNGIDYLINQHKSANEMKSMAEIKNIPLAMHPAAVAFWKKQGVLK